MSRSQRWFVHPALLAFALGTSIPLFWGVMAFVLFSVPEGWSSRLFWHAVTLTCPFWALEGKSALVLIPLLNGLMYALLTWVALKIFRPATAGNCRGH